jgi:hypothetical protein
MGIFADAYTLKLDIPYSEYWLPLLIGMGVGVCALTAGKFALGRRRAAAVPRQQASQPDYDPFTTGSYNDQRKAYRRQGNLTAVNLAIGGNKVNPVPGLVLDRSVGGIGLLVDREFAPGTRLDVLARNAPTTTPWVEIEVRMCRPVDNGEFEIGCQFLKTPPWAILLMFG